MEFNFDRALFFALQRFDSPGMHLKPEQVASICKGKDMKDAFIWLLTRFGKSVCYETTPFVTETILFVTETILFVTETILFVTETILFVTEMILFIRDCKLQRVDSESGKYSSSPGLSSSSIRHII